MLAKSFQAYFYDETSIRLRREPIVILGASLSLSHLHTEAMKTRGSHCEKILYRANDLLRKQLRLIKKRLVSRRAMRERTSTRPIVGVLGEASIGILRVGGGVPPQEALTMILTLPIEYSARRAQWDRPDHEELKKAIERKRLETAGRVFARSRPYEGKNGR